MQELGSDFLIFFFFFFNSMVKTWQAPNPHRIHPWGESIGFLALEREWLRKGWESSAGRLSSAVQVQGQPGLLKVKMVLVQRLPVPTCSLFDVVCGCSLIPADPS